jgi:hypothetical protein
MLVILARENRQVFWPLHRQFLEDGIEVIVDRRHQERRREARASAVDRRCGDRRAVPIDEQLREQGWATVGEQGTRRSRVEWIVRQATMSRGPH